MRTNTYEDVLWSIRVAKDAYGDYFVPTDAPADPLFVVLGHLDYDVLIQGLLESNRMVSATLLSSVPVMVGGVYVVRSSTRHYGAVAMQASDAFDLQMYVISRVAEV